MPWRHRRRNRFGGEDVKFDLGLAEFDGPCDSQMEVLGRQLDCPSPGSGRVNFKYIKERNWGSQLRREVRAVPSPLSHENTSGDTNSPRRWGQLGVGGDTQEAMTHP